MHFICICCQASPSLLHLLTKPPSVVAPLSVSAAKLLRPCLYFLHMLMKQLSKSAVAGPLLPGCLYLHCTRPATAPADKVAACCWAWGLLLPHKFPQDYSLWWTKREPLAGIRTDVLIIIGFEISETSSAGSLRASLSLIMRTRVYGVQASHIPRVLASQ